MDNIVQAASGVMAKTGFADGPPLRAGITIADHTSATYAALGVLAALRQRDASGRGQLVDVAMFDVLTASVWDEPVDHYAAIGMPPRTGNADGRGAPINTYRCADGWISVTCTSDDQWQRRVRRSWIAPTRSSGGRRSASARAARPRSTPRWKRGRRRAGRARSKPRSSAIGLPAGRVRDPIDAADDANLRAARAAHRAAPSRRAGRPAERVSSARRCRSSFAGRVDLPPAELLGTSTDAVLRELAGCDDDDAARDCAPTG